MSATREGTGGTTCDGSAVQVPFLARADCAATGATVVANARRRTDAYDAKRSMFCSSRVQLPINFEARAQVTCKSPKESVFEHNIVIYFNPKKYNYIRTD